MRILYIDVLCKSGSTGKIVYELYTRARADGHEAAVAYGRGAELTEDGIFKFGLDWETAFHALMTRLSGWTGCFSPFSTRRLLKFMDEFKPDVIHLHEPHAYFLNLKPFFNYLSEHKIPLVYTFHCEFAFTGKCGYSYECDGYLTGCGHCPRLKEYPKTMGADHTAAMYEEKKKLLSRLDMTIATPSYWLAEKARGSFLKDRNIRVIRNGIDTNNVFRPREHEHLREKHGLGSQKIVLALAPCFISDERKGAKHVLELARRMENSDIRFIMIGVDADIENLPENVMALGRTENQAELAEYYSMADCFLICSDMENLPTTCLEAVSCGTPVVGFDVGGTAETAPAPIGLFSAYGDMDALEKNLRWMLDNPPASTLFEDLREKYSSENMYREYIELYKEVIK